MAEIMNSHPNKGAELKPFRLVLVEDQFFRQSKLGAIWGTLYFQLGDNEFFPERGWTDLVGAFLRIWLGALISISDGSQLKQSAPFLDGPLAVHLSSYDKNLVELHFVHKGTTRCSATATTEDLLKNSIAVAKEFLVLCRKRGWGNEDTDAVADLCEEATRTLGQAGARRMN
jgi:hypothetical protein